MMQESSHILQCPLCGRVDRVEKVTSVYQAGSSTGNYSGKTTGVGSAGGKLVVMNGRTELSGVQQSWLSQKLTPPDSPAVRIGRRGSSWTPLLILALIGVFA